MNDSALLRVEKLFKTYTQTSGWFSRQRHAVQAVSDVSFDVAAGETLGLVGESGSGKSTVGRLIMQLEAPDSGNVFFDGAPLADADAAQLKRVRRQMQIVFQDPYAALNPRMTVGDFVAEPLIVHDVLAGKAAIEARVAELLSLVGLDPKFIRRYPHEFSGGQRQRVCIARCSRVSSSPTSRSRPSTYPSRPRSSTCSRICRKSSALPTCSSDMTCPWSATCAAAWR